MPKTVQHLVLISKCHLLREKLEGIDILYNLIMNTIYSASTMKYR